MQENAEQKFEGELRIHEALDVASTTPVFALSFLTAFSVLILQIGPTNLTPAATGSLVMLAVMNLMGMQSYYALRHKPRPKAISQRRLKVILISSIVLGTGWGSFNFFMMSPLATHEQMMLYLFACIGAFGGATTFSLRVSWGFSCPLLFLTWLSMLLWGPLEWYINTLTILGAVLAVTQLTFLTRKSAIKGIQLTLANAKALDDQVKAENQMRELARIPEQNPNPVMRITDDSELIYANKASAPLINALNLSVGDHVGTDWRTHLTKGLNEDQRQDFEYEFGGQIYAILLWPVPEGGYTNVYGRDITAQKRAASELESLVKELGIARDAAIHANSAKSQFLANMSHELRTPLNAIIGYSELLIDDMADDENEAYIPDLTKIQTAGKHLLGLINDILDLSKIEVGKTELFIEEFDLAELLNEVADTIEPLVKKNQNVLDIQVSDVIITMKSDKTKLRQILFNLLSNAAKFSTDATLVLRATRVADKDGDHIKFEVEDQGIGMTPDQLENIFKPFTQADSSTSKKFGGTGLGLTITREFCRLMGGDITVKSEIDVGTTFTMSILVDASAMTKVTETEALMPIAQIDGDSPLVLIIDDDINVRDLLQRNLNNAGYRTELAQDGQEGLVKALALRPDAITLDVIMPRSDGWSVLSELKLKPETRDIPVIMVTIIEDRKLGFSLGASEYLSKPVDRDKLISVLERFLGKPENCSVLLVEDDAITRNVFRRFLEKENVTLIEAENGKIAMDMLAKSKPDLILLDLLMPEMDGFEFIDEYRKKPDWQDIPIVVVTAKVLTKDDRERLEGWIEGLYSKLDNEMEQILANIQAMLPKQK